MAILTPTQALELAAQYRRSRRFADAEALLRQILDRDPQNTRATHELGLLAHETGHAPEALAWLQRSIDLQPGIARFHNDVGLLLTDQGRLEEAVAAFEAALRLEPNNAEIHFNLGNAHWRQRQWDAAIAAQQTAVRLDPKLATAWLNLSAILIACQLREEALECCQTGLRHCPRDPALLFGLGNVHKELGHFEKALRAYQDSLRAARNNASVLNNLGTLHKERGDFSAAIATLRQSLAVRYAPEVHSNLINISLYDPETTAESLYEEQRRWNSANFYLPHPDHPIILTHDPSPERRLRIGYVSADLHNHVVGRTLLPIFEAHDPAQVECICYAGPAFEPIAQRFQARADHWYNVERASDKYLRGRIFDDQIDILVDLSLHTASNRLPIFAVKIVPIQVSWLGYPGSTGVDTIDYFLTDRFLHPPTETDPNLTSNRPFHLPDAWCCYPAPDNSPEITPLPALRNGHITFASFNNAVKINGPVLNLWARVLQAVHNSRLVLLAKDSDQQKRFQDTLQAHGITPGRLEFLPYEPVDPFRDAASWLDRYARVDIALDPFPYNGMTTTGDALWMGVPVIALRGPTCLSRASFSLLSNLNLPELIAANEDDYVQRARDLANNLPHLSELRATLRTRMQSSPLLDYHRFAQNLESAYRTMWRHWCAQKSSASLPTNP